MTAQSASAPVLKAQTRTITGKQSRALRRDGLIPAIVYGHDQKNQVLSLDQHEFEQLFNEAGHSTLVDLVIDDQKPFKVLIHEVQTHAVKHNVLHADFYQVNLKEKLTTEIPLNFVGVAPAVEIEGGTFITVRSEVEIECLPEDLVQELEVDISGLKTFDDTLTIADLTAPKGIVILDDPEQVIASVAEPRSEEEMAALDEAPAVTTETEFGTTSGTDATETPEGDTKKEDE